MFRSCRLYVENPFVAAGLKALANFTYRVTMPCLNFVEVSSQSDLVDLLPMLFKNLANGDLNKMVNYRINWTHIKVTSSTLHQSYKQQPFV